MNKVTESLLALNPTQRAEAIDILQQANALENRLARVLTGQSVRGRKAGTSAASNGTATTGKRQLSAESIERIRQGQLKRREREAKEKRAKERAAKAQGGAKTDSGRPTVTVGGKKGK